MPKRICIACRHLFDMATVKGERCPACRREKDAERGTTAERGYGAAHQHERTERLAAWSPGDPCAWCRQPMWDASRIQLGHRQGKRGYRGLEHDTCNEGHR